MAIEKLHIAPCGMNCSLCSSYQREKEKCPGCKVRIQNNSTRCTILNCPRRTETESGFCYECLKYPCKRMQALDTRYRQKYGMSMAENLEMIRTQGNEKFEQVQRERWTCPKCGKLLCVHNPKCLHCRGINERYPRKNGFHEKSTPS